MPQVIAAVGTAIEATASFLAAEASAAAFTLTGGSIAADVAVNTFVYTAVNAAATLAVYAGLSLALQPKIPKPETGLLTFKQAVPVRRRAWGEVRSGGPMGFWDVVGDTAYDLVLFHDGKVNAVLGWYLNDQLQTVIGGIVQTGADGRYPSPQVKIDYRLGETVETPYSQLIAAFPGTWTSAHRGDGIFSALLSCQNGKLVHQDHNFPNGKPLLSAHYESQAVFDPRNVDHDEADPSTWTYAGGGRNPALQLLTYLMHERGFAYDWTADEQATFNAENWARYFGNTLTYWADAADVCDEPIELAAGGTEPRYQCGFQYQLDQDEATVINALIVAMDAWMGPNGEGGLILRAGKFVPPTVVLGDADIKTLSIDRGVEIENQVNQIDITFTDPAKAFNTAEADPWVDDAAIALVGRALVEKLDLPQVQSFTQGRRLAKGRMERHRALWRGSITTEFSTEAGKDVRGERFLQLRLTAGPASVANAVVEVTDTPSINFTDWTITFPCTSVDADARDGWNPAEDEGAPPPVGTPTDPSVPVPPTIDTISASYGIDANPILTLNVTGADRADLTWEIRWRLDGTTLWQPTEFPDDGGLYPSAVLQSGLVPADVLLEVQVEYQNGGGVFSGWSASAFVDTSGAWPTADNTTITADSMVWTADREPE